LSGVRSRSRPPDPNSGEGRRRGGLAGAPRPPRRPVSPDPARARRVKMPGRRRPGRRRPRQHLPLSALRPRKASPTPGVVGRTRLVVTAGLRTDGPLRGAGPTAPQTIGLPRNARPAAAVTCQQAKANAPSARGPAAGAFTPCHKRPRGPPSRGRSSSTYQQERVAARRRYIGSEPLPGSTDALKEVRAFRRHPGSMAA
jgi:hypothetical protein